MKIKIITFILILITCFSYVFASQNITINSKSAVAIDGDSSVVLYNKNADKKVYPASTTKILTAILAIENLDLNKSVVVSKSAINIPWDSSSVYLKEGEVITINDLLYCLLLNSGNDAANVLAEAVSGEINAFVKLMNEKAIEIGCTNTHFTNAHGYSDDNHYTTAMDMAKIFKYCTQNKEFIKIISTKSYVVEKTNKTNEKRYLNNTNRLILKKEDSIYARPYEYCLGGKTGYTNEAGRTLVTYARKDNRTIIVTIFGASSGGREDVRYTDAINLFEYAFNNFSQTTIAKAEDYNFNYINTEKKLNYHIGLKEDIKVLIANNAFTDVSYDINIAENNLIELDYNNYKEAVAGTITFKLLSDNNTSHEIVHNLYLKDIQKHSAPLHTNLLFMFFIVVIFALIILLISIIILHTIKKKHNSKVIINKNSRKARRV